MKSCGGSWIREGRTRGIEVDGGGCRLTSRGKHDVSCKRGRNGIAIPDERAARTAMDPIAEPLFYSLSTEAVLREHGGPRRRTKHATRLTGDACDLAGLELDRRQ